MTESWFEPTFYAWFGALAGGVGGSLAGLFAGLSVLLINRNKCRQLVLGGYVLFLTLGLMVLGYGIVALVVGQPWGIWWGPVYGGAVTTIACGFLIPLVRLRYRQAEERRLQAEAPRHSDSSSSAS